jgi:hypothetical protein
MTRFQVDVEKFTGTEYWTNVYHVEAATAAAAKTAGDAIVAAERPIHYTWVGFSTMRIRPVGVGQTGVNYALNTVGTRGSTSVALPLFNCLRVDFANGTARPCRKYLRGCINIGELNGSFGLGSGTLTPATTYANAIVAVSGICDPQGRTLSGGAPYTLVAMHQLRRGNRRRPILP